MKSNFLKMSVLLSSALMTIQCGGGGPGYVSKNGSLGDDLNQKPKSCKVAFHKTCWKDTVSQITSCLKPDQGSDQFSESHQLCGNDSGKLIVFQNPTDLFSRPFDAIHSVFKFKVVPDRINECFEVNGTMSNLEVKMLKTGEVAKFSVDGDKMSVTCLDGQQVTVSRKNFEDCQQVAGEESRFVPGVEAGPFFQNKIEKGWFFKFKGGGDIQAEVFRCLH